MTDTQPEWYAEYRRRAEAKQLEAPPTDEVRSCGTCAHTGRDPTDNPCLTCIVTGNREKWEPKQEPTEQAPAAQPIKPCRFCGSGDVYFDDGRSSTFIACHSCKACGPDGKSEAEAVELWNAAPSQADLESARQVAIDALAREAYLFYKLNKSKQRIAELEDALRPFALQLIHAGCHDEELIRAPLCAFHYRKARAVYDKRTDAAAR